MSDLVKHIKAGGTVQTRDGQEVTIYAAEANPVWPIHGAVAGVWTLLRLGRVQSASIST